MPRWRPRSPASPARPTDRRRRARSEIRDLGPPRRRGRRIGQQAGADDTQRYDLRTCTVLAKDHCELFAVERAAFLQICKDFPVVREHFMRVAKERVAHTNALEGKVARAQQERRKV